MKRGSGKILGIVLTGAVCAIGSVFFMCGNSTGTSDPAPSSTTLQQLVLESDAVTGWSRLYGDTLSAYDTLYYFDQSNLNNLVNGGNTSYCGNCNGSSPMRQAAHYSMVNTANQYKVDIFTFDYGTVPAGKTEFDARAAALVANYTKVVLPSFAESVALGGVHSGSLRVAGHLAQYYFELDFSGYGSGANAAADASAFMTVFQAKVK